MLIFADALEGLKQIADNSVDCCVTSPPYYNLRAFGFEISRDFYKRAVNEMLLDEENQVNSGNAQQLVLPI